MSMVVSAVVSCDIGNTRCEGETFPKAKLSVNLHLKAVKPFPEISAHSVF